MTQNAPRPWSEPQLRELDLLVDSGIGFSEPDPPGAAPDSDRDRNDEAAEDELFDWL